MPDANSIVNGPGPKLVAPEPEMLGGSLLDEEWREYDFDNRVYRIVAPAQLFFRKGGSTHRVVDVAGVVHCVPGPGYRGCVLRWKTLPGKNPVAF